MLRWTFLACCAAAVGCSSGSIDERSPPAADGPFFREAAAEIGLDFQHFIGASGKHYIPEVMGAGVALIDYDGDGDLDVFLPQGTMLDPAIPPEKAQFAPPSSGYPGDRLYRNELIPSGQLRFTDVSRGSGLDLVGYGMGAAVGDFNNDGRPDLFVTRFGPNSLYRNNGDGTFSDVTTPGLDDPRWSTSAAFFDYDGDGDLDLFFANYVDFTIRNNKECFDPTGARDYCTPNVYNSVPDRLFRNDGGRFVDVSIAAGLGAAFGNGLGVVCADFDGDGREDVYVANDGTANQLWINRGDGTFEDTALMAGAAYNADGVAEAGMGVTAGDFDGDGDMDLFMTHLALETNTLYVNNGRGEFRDATSRYGLGVASMPYTGFGSRWFDFDHDALLDLFMANGGVTIMESLRGDPYPFRQKNQLYRFDGERYHDVSADAGPAFEVAEVSRGAAFGDIDNDGNDDIVVSNNNGPVRLLLNQVGSRNNWTRLKPRGTNSNRDAYGARVAALLPDGRRLWRRVGSDGSYLSASESVVTLGLGTAERLDGVGVIWPNGERELFIDVKLGETNELVEGGGSPWVE